ncbi:MAG: EscU/YscU/HrcU family type III secretion system export apparatus switch protein [Lachnospiraceae bacterium]|nr:EscU/YscU/HrcU family type III secretion system export apparatus switch protein [Lachnospiraceae bacterium]MBO7600855.1 EscU/YscU/HrcU family type III secretion system export apparatus switch protein [Lachnospiraceae bacterium]
MADEIKKNNSKQAIALQYDPDDIAPRVLATGQGLVAEKILETAKDNDVPIHKDEQLAKTLSKLEVGDAIPPELYEVVAEILVFVDAMDKIKGKMDRN